VSRPANDVVVITLDGESHLAVNAPGHFNDRTDYRALRIVERPDHVWICQDREATGCLYVIPPHAVMRVWVRQLVDPDAVAFTTLPKPEET
jgi:hypothetical protein